MREEIFKCCFDVNQCPGHVVIVDNPLRLGGSLDRFGTNLTDAENRPAQGTGKGLVVPGHVARAWEWSGKCEIDASPLHCLEQFIPSKSESMSWILAKVNMRIYDRHRSNSSSPKRRRAFPPV